MIEDERDPGNAAALVSIVIPCHGYGRYLPEAIESALEQTYPNVEVVVVNDGSSDDTAEIVRRYPVRSVSQAQAGVCVAADRGIAASRGTFVMRLDADDVLEPTYVTETLRALQSHPEVDFAYTDVVHFGAWHARSSVPEFSPETLAERNYVHVSALMRRAAYERAGGYRPEMSWSHCEDWDLWLTFAELGMRGVLVPKPLLRYRQHRPGGGPNEPRLSLPWIARAMRITAAIQDDHPYAFAPRLLLHRLSTLPRRLATREVSRRHALVVTGMCSLMLLRLVLGRVPRSRSRSAGPVAGSPNADRWGT